MGALGQVAMYLDAYTAGGAPAACPAGWSQIDYENVVAGSGNNWERTCLSPNGGAHTVMYLATYTSAGTPALCPSGFIQADYQQVYAGVSGNWKRTCFY